MVGAVMPLQASAGFGGRGRHWRAARSIAGNAIGQIARAVLVATLPQCRRNLGISSESTSFDLAGKMTRSLAAFAAAIFLVSSGALAQERAGDAGLGAVAGALVLGPVGAI